MPSSTRNVDDFLIREIALTHDPDDEKHLDSEQLLNLVEAIFSCSAEYPIVGCLLLCNFLDLFHFTFYITYFLL